MPEIIQTLKPELVKYPAGDLSEIRVGRGQHSTPLGVQRLGQAKSRQIFIAICQLTNFYNEKARKRIFDRLIGDLRSSHLYQEMQYSNVVADYLANIGAANTFEQSDSAGKLFDMLYCSAPAEDGFCDRGDLSTQAFQSDRRELCRHIGERLYNHADDRPFHGLLPRGALRDMLALILEIRAMDPHQDFDSAFVRMYSDKAIRDLFEFELREYCGQADYRVIKVKRSGARKVLRLVNRWKRSLGGRLSFEALRYGRAAMRVLVKGKRVTIQRAADLERFYFSKFDVPLVFFPRIDASLGKRRLIIHRLDKSYRTPNLHEYRDNESTATGAKLHLSLLSTSNGKVSVFWQDEHFVLAEEVAVRIAGECPVLRASANADVYAIMYPTTSEVYVYHAPISLIRRIKIGTGHKFHTPGARGIHDWSDNYTFDFDLSHDGKYLWYCTGNLFSGINLFSGRTDFSWLFYLPEILQMEVDHLLSAQELDQFVRGAKVRSGDHITPFENRETGEWEEIYEALQPNLLTEYDRASLFTITHDLNSHRLYIQSGCSSGIGEWYGFDYHGNALCRIVTPDSMSLFGCSGELQRWIAVPDFEGPKCVLVNEGSRQSCADLGESKRIQITSDHLIKVFEDQVWVHSLPCEVMLKVQVPQAEFYNYRIEDACLLIIGPDRIFDVMLPVN